MQQGGGAMYPPHYAPQYGQTPQQEQYLNQPQMSAQPQPEQPPEDYCGLKTSIIGGLLFVACGPLVLLTLCYKCDRRQWYQGGYKYLW